MALQAIPSSLSLAEESQSAMERNNSINNAVSDCKLNHPLSQKKLADKKLHDAVGCTSPGPQCNLARSIAIVATCTGAVIVNISNTYSISTSLPTIGKALDIQEDQLQWLLSAYSMSSGCLLLLFGHLEDLLGRKKGFLIGMLWQIVCALGLGFSSNGLNLCILRGFQGIGAAAAIPAALGILAQAFPPSRTRSIAFATFAAGNPIGCALGTMFGSILTQLTSEHWRAPFFLCAGLSALCVIGGITSFHPDNASSEGDPRVDWIGASLVTSGLVLIVFVLAQGSTVGWKTPYIIALLVIGVILVCNFLVWENHLEKSAARPDKPKSVWTAPPLMKLSIWTRAKGRMAVIITIAFLTWSGFASWIFWVQLFYQNYLGLTPVATMTRLIPMFISGILCNFFFGLVVSKLPLVVFVVLGTVVTGFASVLFALVDPSTTYWAFEFPSTIMIVFGADFVYSSGTLFVANIALPHERSLAGGLFQTMTQLGTVFGLTMSTIVFNSVVDKLNSQGTSASVSAEFQGYTAAHWTCAAFPFFASLLAVIFLRDVGVIGHRRYQEENLPEQTTVEQKADAEP